MISYVAELLKAVQKLRRDMAWYEKGPRGTILLYLVRAVEAALHRYSTTREEDKALLGTARGRLRFELGVRTYGRIESPGSFAGS